MTRPDPRFDPLLDPDEDDSAPRPLFSAGFWVALGLGLVLVLAGATVGLFGTKLFPAHPHATLHR
jgi:hypothetical protein